jgi:hypothetical protein
MAGWRLERQHPNNAGASSQNAEQAGGRLEEGESFSLCLLTPGLSGIQNCLFSSIVHNIVNIQGGLKKTLLRFFMNAIFSI